jgi:hypothetical protein
VGVVEGTRLGLRVGTCQPGRCIAALPAYNAMRRCPCYLRLGVSLMTGKTNVRPVDGPAVTDRNKH